MREIKFRAWDNELKNMTSDFGIWAIPQIVENIKEGDMGNEIVLMQYTGLKDKNGKEIYEGDIIRTLQGGMGNHEYKNMLVEWKNDSAYKQRVAYFEPFANYWINMLTTEIIGNIYENPELLPTQSQEYI